MTKQTINVGATANDKKGDSLRAAFTKVNANFTELYTALGLNSNTTLNLGAFEFTGSTMSTTDSTAITIDQAVTVSSNLTIGGDILPNIANGGNLGSAAKPFKSLYVSNSTVYLGGVPLSLDAGTNELKINNVPVSQTITYTDIPNFPSVPTDVSDLTDTTGLLGGGSANTGNITFDNEIISAPNGTNIQVQAKDSGGTVNSSLELNSEFAVAKLTAKSEGGNTFYSGSDFTSATWEPYEEVGQQRSRLIFVGATSLHDFISNNEEFSKSGDNENGEWTVDGINFYPWPYSTGWAEETGTLTVEFYDAQVIPPPESTVTVETFALRWINESKVAVDLEDYSQLDIVGVGVDVKVESTRSINVEAGDGVNVLAANNLNLESVNGVVKIAAAIYSNNSQWTFSPLLTGEGTAPAKITFPDNTVQTTAWAGGRVVPAPGSSLGASGDKAGDMAFSSDYFYYCIADHTDGSSTIWKRVAWSLDDNW